MANKSAKDLAFDKERAKFRKQIRELERELNQRDTQVMLLREQLSLAEKKNQELQEWNDRLLAYTEMSEDDMRAVIRKEKDSAQVMESVNALFGVSKKLTSSYL